MRWRRRRLVLFVISIISFFGLGALVVLVPPDQGAPFPIVSIFFILLFLATTIGTSFLFKNIWFGIVIGILITSFFLLRLFF